MKKIIAFSINLLIISSISFGQSSTILPNTSTHVADGTNQVLKIINTNTSNSSRIMEVITNGGSDALSVTHSGGGDGINSYKTSDTGKAGLFNISNSSNQDEAVWGATNGKGYAGYFVINNSTNANSSVFGTTNGSGSGIGGTNTGTTGKAGSFAINNILNGNPIISATTTGYGTGIDVSTGLGVAGKFSSSSGYALITGTGNVGIGTTTPNEKLEVTGKIRSSNLSGAGTRHVYADANGTLTTTAAQTSYYTIGALDFTPANGSPTNLVQIAQYVYFTTVASNTLYAPIHVPIGATMTSITIYYEDAAATDLSFNVFATSMTTQSFTNTAAGTTSNATTSTTTALNYLVDASKHYALQITGTWGVSTIKIWGASVTYTY